MNPRLKSKLLDVLVGSSAVAVGVIIILAAEWFVEVRMEFFWGVSTFSPAWVVTLFLIPCVAGLAVALIYGFGGKLLAMFPPALVEGYNYLQVEYYGVVPAFVPEGASLLPFIYWILLVVIAIEFGGIGGFIGEVLVKRTYGRTPKHLLHAKYSKDAQLEAKPLK